MLFSCFHGVRRAWDFLTCWLTDVTLMQGSVWSQPFEVLPSFPFLWWGACSGLPHCPPWPPTPPGCPPPNLPLFQGGSEANSVCNGLMLVGCPLLVGNRVLRGCWAGREPVRVLSRAWSRCQPSWENGGQSGCQPALPFLLSFSRCSWINVSLFVVWP